MAHRAFVRDTVTGDCGLAVVPCPTVVQSGDLSVAVTFVGTPETPAYDLSYTETVTSLTYDPISGMLVYTDEVSGTANIDLSALATDIFVNGGSYNPASQVLTLTDNDGVTPDIVIPLGALASILTQNNLTSQVTHTSGNGTITTFRRVSANAGNDIIIGSDGGAYLDICAYVGTLPNLGPLQCIP